MAALSTTALLLAGTAGPSSAGTPSKRILIERYRGSAGLIIQAPTGHSIGLGGCSSNKPGCILVPLRSGDTHLKVEVSDATGREVAIYMVDEDHQSLGVFCEADAPKVAIPKVEELWVGLVTGTCGGATEPSVPTEGTVYVTIFSGRARQAEPVPF